MPCYTGEYDQKSGVSVGTLQSMWRHNSPVAEMLCEAVKRLRECGQFDTCSYDLRQWADEHDRRDRLRAYREKQRAERAIK